MLYNRDKLYINSDFEIRTIREDEGDIDLFIPIENRSLSLYFDDTRDFLCSRMQFSIVKNLIFRFSTDVNNNTATIHMLKSIDLHSSVVNFEIDYSNHMIEIDNKEYSVEMRIKRKDEGHRSM